MIFKKAFASGWVLVALASPLVIAAGCTRTARDIRQLPVIKVNETVMTAGEFSDRLADRLKLFDDLSAKDSNVLKRTKKLIVQDFIVQSVTQHWAKRHQIFVRKEDLDSEVNKIRKEYPDDIAFRKSLADQGLTFDAWEERLRVTLLQELVQETLMKGVARPSSDEMKTYYSAHRSELQLPAALHIRQIVVANEADADRIRAALKAGKSFAALAKKFSITPEGANGGDLGWVEKTPQNVFSAKPYPLKQWQVVKSAYGYQIFQILEKRSGRPLTFEEAKKRIERQLLAESEQTVYSDWLEKQVLKSHIYKNDSLIDHIYVQDRSEN